MRLPVRTDGGNPAQALPREVLQLLVREHAHARLTSTLAGAFRRRLASAAGADFLTDAAGYGNRRSLQVTRIEARAERRIFAAGCDPGLASRRAHISQIWFLAGTSRTARAMAGARPSCTADNG